MGIYSTITVSRNASIDFIQKQLANCTNEQLANILHTMIMDRGHNCIVEDMDYSENDDYLIYFD